MIKRFFKKILFVSKLFGLDIYKAVLSFIFLPKMIYDALTFKKTKDFKFSFYPIIVDKYLPAGTTKSQYFIQDLYFAKKIYKNSPDRHFDIGSRIDGFVSHLATFREVFVFDLRKLDIDEKNISFVQLDFMGDVSKYHNTVESLSCLHAIEHFGLGRYGDKLDPDGHLKGLNNLYHILKPNGVLYFSTPIGKNKVVFNAHRIFSLEYLKLKFKERFQIIELSIIDDNGKLFRNLKLNNIPKELYSLNFGLGMFTLKKI